MIFTKKDKRTNLEREIDVLVLKLAGTFDEHSKEYGDNLAILERLVSLNDKIQNQKKDTVSKDTLVVVAGNLLGIALILSYEKLNIITSKALSFVIKGRA